MSGVHLYSRTLVCVFYVVSSNLKRQAVQRGKSTFHFVSHSNTNIFHHNGGTILRNRVGCLGAIFWASCGPFIELGSQAGALLIALDPSAPLIKHTCLTRTASFGFRMGFEKVIV